MAGDVEALRKHQLLARLLLSHKFQDQGLKTTQPDNAAAEALRLQSAPPNWNISCADNFRGLARNVILSCSGSLDAVTPLVATSAGDYKDVAVEDVATTNETCPQNFKDVEVEDV